MIEYGQSYLAQNEACLELLSLGMSPEAFAFAQEMAEEMMAEDD